MAKHPFSPLESPNEVEKFAGLVTQFEPIDGVYHFRRQGWGAAIRVSPEEREAFVREGRRALLIHLAALPLCAVAAWLVIGRVMADHGANARAALFGCVLPVLAALLYRSWLWHADAPGRALADRPAELPPRDPDFSYRSSYRMILAGTILMLFLAAIGTQRPASFYVAVATGSVTAGLLLLVHKWRSERRLTPAQRLAASAHDRQHASSAAEGAERPFSLLALILLLFFIVLQLIVAICGFALGMGAVLAAAQRTADSATTFLLVLASVAGLIVGFLGGWLIERLCKRLTGVSAIGALSFIPPSW